MGDRQLRIAFLAFRGNPHSGGQGVYTRHLTRELARLGHEVEVFAGQPYPLLDEGVRLTPLPGLDLYRQPDPWRTPAPEEFRDWIDVGEFAGMRSGGYPEPAAFSLRARRALRTRRGDFDLVHDNQSLGWGLLGMIEDGWPVVATMHHPITVDRALDYAHVTTDAERTSVRRWYGFVDMQMKVAAEVPKVLTVSTCSADGLAADMGVPQDRISIVPVGVDCQVFRPSPAPRTPGMFLATASADSPLKGLVPLVEALAKVRTEHPQANLTIVGRPRQGSPAQQTIERLGLEGAVTFSGPLEAHEIVELYDRAEVAVVPSLYEGFSLPAVEAMACAVPLVATTGGALPEVVGRDGEAALMVPPNDPSALAAAMGRVLSDAELRARLGAAGRQRVLTRFTWQATAKATAAHYEDLLARGRQPTLAASR
ncbi:MAG TPA: glycosyltransferase family 4 protein [Acidimicrobiales bacterium]|nr:glycosyltransferase family 4 protein [Acidimicrobiales bacterium]